MTRHGDAGWVGVGGADTAGGGEEEDVGRGRGGASGTVLRRVQGLRVGSARRSAGFVAPARGVAVVIHRADERLHHAERIERGLLAALVASHMSATVPCDASYSLIIEPSSPCR